MKKIYSIIVGFLLMISLACCVTGYIKNKDSDPKDSQKPNTSDKLIDENTIPANEIENDMKNISIPFELSKFIDDKEIKSLNYMLKKFDCTEDNLCYIKLSDDVQVVLKSFKNSKNETYNKLYINNKETNITTTSNLIDDIYVSIFENKYVLFYDLNLSSEDAIIYNYYLFDKNGKIVVNFNDYGIKNSIFKNIFYNDSKFYIISSILASSSRWNLCFKGDEYGENPVTRNANDSIYTAIDNKDGNTLDSYELNSDGTLKFIKNLDKVSVTELMKNSYNKSCEEIRKLGYEGASKKYSVNK